MDVELESGLIREPAKYAGRLYRVNEADSLNSSGKKKNSFVLISCGRDNCYGVCVSKVLIILGIGARRRSKSREYAFLH